ncbi:MAG: flagellar basal body P-ring protein FlgI [Thermoguttaceae bacterium]|jgi:flagellar basal body P-ring protein FlgI|nr:flagellar basal body P-ring protein FlgI [Thermoguttaceae bacterium]
MKSRREFVLCGLVLLGGCSTWDKLTMRSQSPETPEETKKSATRLVGDLAVPYNLHPVVLESVGLVTGLKGTGSDPKPSPQRDVLVSEMQLRGVEAPNRLLASGNVSLVLVRAVIRPGIQKDDCFDVEVRVPSQSETTSLRGGYLLQTHLKELQVLDNAVHSGHAYGVAEGPVLVDPSADSKNDKVLSCRGRILGGGRALKSRPLALVLKDKSIQDAATIETAINRRFHTFDRGLKQGVARAKDDQYVHLNVHPRYKDNIQRYMAVLRSVALRESETERIDRLAMLERQLLDPITASRAALQLEAIGKPGIDVLVKGIQSGDPEVRFYAAEALAYLDDSRAAAPLADAARNVPAFRVFALTALSAMNDITSAEKLREMLHLASAETRYGAFRALWAMNANDPAIRGEMLGGQFGYHVLDTAGPPMVHVTRSRRAEVVLFGRDQVLRPPFSLEAGNRILITSRGGDEATISKFAVNEPDQKRVVSTRIDDVLRTVVELGGTYPDVVQALQQAKACGALASRFEVDALPEAGRTYDRVADGAEEKGKSRSGPTANSPLPDLFAKADAKPLLEDREPASSKDAVASEPEEKPGAVRAFFTRLNPFR